MSEADQERAQAIADAAIKQFPNKDEAIQSLKSQKARLTALNDWSKDEELMATDAALELLLKG